MILGAVPLDFHKGELKCLHTDSINTVPKVNKFIFLLCWSIKRLRWGFKRNYNLRFLQMNDWIYNLVTHSCCEHPACFSWDAAAQSLHREEIALLDSFFRTVQYDELISWLLSFPSKAWQLMLHILAFHPLNLISSCIMYCSHSALMVHVRLCEREGTVEFRVGCSS